MRCPKCHYVSFGSVDRCRNCGYEFLLAVEPPPVDLPIQRDDQAIGPLADFVLTERSLAPQPPSVFPESTSHSASAAGSAARRVSTGSSRLDLPLFGGADAGDDAPPLTAPAVPRTPLSVRRGQPAIARPRPERALQSDDPEPGSPRILRVRDGRGVETGLPREVSLDAPKPGVLESASVGARLLAGLLDIVVLGTIDAAILYFTLRLVDLPVAEIWSLPPVPLGVFLLLLNGGYLAIFTVAGGQTIGKMLTGIKVVADRSTEDLEADGAGFRVSVGVAVLRATAYLVSLLPAGLGFAAILFDSDGRALHDRLAETRVVKA
jgi:uncharacterized RDD family membrane protein YckC